MKHFLLLVVFALLTHIDLAQNTKFWVKLKDKNSTPYSLSNPAAYLHPASIARRTAHAIAIDSTDLPVNPSYIMQVDNIGGVNVLYASKWLNGLVIQVTNTTVLSSVNALSFVAGTGPAGRPAIRISEPGHKEVKQNGYSELAAEASPSLYNYGYSYWQNHMLGVDCMHDKGFRGQGITIGVFDSGFSNVDNMAAFDTLRARNAIKGTVDLVNGGSNVYNGSDHGTKVLSCLAACRPGVMIGAAPLADYWLFRTENPASEKLIEEYNWVRAAEFADSLGADILSTSLVYTDFDDPSQDHPYNVRDGKTAPMSIASTMAARKGMFVVTAAGNDGPNYIGIPADADSICTVGAVDSLGAAAGISSVGPTADGRIKPELVAMGAGVTVLSTSGNPAKEMGTSFATPLLAGAVACFMQEHPSYSNHRTLDSLKRRASQASTPDNKRGWGVPNVCGLSPVGLAELHSTRSSVSVFPNPCQSFVELHFNEQEHTAPHIEILNVLGQSFYTHMPQPGETTLQVNTSQWPQGVFLIKVETASGSLLKKIVKQ